MKLPKLHGGNSVKIVVSLLILSAIIGYGLFQSNRLIEGPTITLTTPQDGSTVHNPLLTISGNAQDSAYLTLDGNKIYTNEKGDFTQKLLAAPGYTILSVTATDKYGRESTHLIHIVYSPES